MRHQKKGHKLGRTKAHRKAMLANLGCALIEHKRVTTTLPKAKALRPFIEPLITRSKDDTTHNRRQVFRHLRSKEAVDELFYEVAEEVGDRPGGYTRVIKLGRRHGDGAEMAMVELVDYNDVPPETDGGGRKRTRRGGGKGRRRRSRRQEPSEAQQQVQEEPQVEDVAVEEADADVQEEAAAAEEVDAAQEVEAVETPEEEAPEAEAPGDEQSEAPEAETEEAPESSAEGDDESPEEEDTDDETKEQ